MHYNFTKKEQRREQWYGNKMNEMPHIVYKLG